MSLTQEMDWSSQHIPSGNERALCWVAYRDQGWWAERWTGCCPRRFLQDTGRNPRLTWPGLGPAGCAPSTKHTRVIASWRHPSTARIYLTQLGLIWDALVPSQTYNDLEVVTGDNGVSVLDPLDRGSRRPRDLALKDDVHGLMGINVGGPPHELGRNCGIHRKTMSQAEVKNNKITGLLELVRWEDIND